MRDGAFNSIQIWCSNATQRRRFLSKMLVGSEKVGSPKGRQPSKTVRIADQVGLLVEAISSAGYPPRRGAKGNTPMSGRETLSGGCLCGAVRYEIEHKPKAVCTCHCTDCQRLTGSAFSMAILVPAEMFPLMGLKLGLHMEAPAPDPEHALCRSHFLRSVFDSIECLRSMLQFVQALGVSTV